MAQDNLYSRIYTRANDIAQSKKHQYISIEHILKAMFSEEQFRTLVQTCGGQLQQLQRDVDTYLEAPNLVSLNAMYDKPQDTRSTKEVFQRGMAQDIFAGSQDMTIEGLALSILSEQNSHANAYMQKNGITRESILAILRTRHGASPRSPQHGRDSHQSEPTSALDEFCEHLTSVSDHLDNLVGRSVEIDELVHVLARRKKNNAILVGEPGVGKTAIIEGLAKKIASGNVPETLKDAEIFSLDVSLLVSGTRLRGEFEERLVAIVDELSEMPNAILFVDEIHNIMGAGTAKDSALDAANILKPALADGRIRCIGATTYNEFYEYIESDTALMRRFYKIDVVVPTKAETYDIIMQSRAAYAEYHGIEVPDLLIEKVVNLAEDYIHNKHNPDKSFDVLDFSMAHAKLRGEEGEPVLCDDDIVFAVSKLANIAPENIMVRDTEKLQNLDKQIKDQVYGQDEAVDELIEAVLMRKAGVTALTRPIYSALMAGTTGTGKTWLAKNVAKALNTKLVRFDMSEFSEQHSISKLIGAPPGYVGFSEGRYGNGKLISEVEENPTAVFLFDEIEKAHQDILTILLQVLDEGKLTSSTGKTVDFSNTIVLMTSNLGAQDSESRVIGFGASENTDAVDKAIKQFLKPELRNRLDKIIKFKKLGATEVLKIVSREIDELNVTLAKRNVQISATPAAKKFLANEGFDDKMGARPLRRIVEQQVKKPISKEMLFGDLKEGGIVKIDLANGKLKVSVVLSREATNKDDAIKADK